MSKYKVAVLGPIPRDHITTYEGKIIKRYGCATHTAVVLSKLLGDDGVVIPVTHVREQDKQGTIEEMAGHDNISMDHINTYGDQGDVVQLKFVDQNNRLEKQTGFMNPITPHDLTDLLDCDAFVCVPITDYEVPLPTLQFIKKNSSGTIIFDAHGPTNCLTTSGDRLTRFWADRDMWLPYIDVLKMNLEESRCCWFKKEYEMSELVPFDESTDHLYDFASHCLNHGVKSVIVTLDSSGGAVFYKEGDEVKEEYVKSVKVDHVVDTTGCGDSFAGGLGFGLLTHPDNYITAAKYANAMGSQRTQGRTWDVFKNRKETEEQIISHYGSI